jgi:hypothetical protein
MYWSSFCVCREQATLRIYIQWSYLFFPSHVYLRESTNRAISYTRWWDGYGLMSFAHNFFHDAALYSFFFPFHSLLDKRKNKRVCLYDIVLLLDIFFSPPFLEFFSSMSQNFCSRYRSNTSRIFFAGLYYLSVFFWSFFVL